MRQIAQNRLLSGLGTISSLSLSKKKKKKKDYKVHKDLLLRFTIMISIADQANLTYIKKKAD